VIRGSILVLAGTLAGLSGCKASPPNRWEARAVTFAKHHITVGGRNEKNPLPATQENWEDGKEAFAHYCVACHGNDGQNTGVPFADHLSPPIPSLASSEVQTYTDGQLKWILDYGLYPSGMPGSKGTLSDDELWSIVIFLRHLPNAGSVGVPTLYNE
jgi:mono/diheme cytochrome c family protein